MVEQIAEGEEILNSEPDTQVSNWELFYMEEINNFIEAQLAVWPEAAERYHALGKTERRFLDLNLKMPWALQFNPARIVSTSAKTDARSIAARKCFLCHENRPDCQIAVPVCPGWEMLVNPFPIFPVHFTIVSTNHEPQLNPPPEMLQIADMFKGLCVFFNGAKAGASAPDHSHIQAVLACELPLMLYIETLNIADNDIVSDNGESAGIPFIASVITPDADGMNIANRMMKITGRDKISGELDRGLRNVYVWKSLKDGKIRIVVIPRSAHRPDCYGENQFLVSPGCIDMAGVIITPRRSDFDTLTPDDITNILQDVT